ncbi:MULTISPECIES: T9SS type A sorting domain-containing protein [Flavobacterium]|uniref:T9SS type A sorting domain-containing protein n=1 Tax=Flavobacterium TaxID=237 RepID=UPI001FCAB3E6|nr:MULTISPECIES: T9SS type A sorting domain-containing protein [Flavobacterium]UOK41500.1 T9SS type A sorting domain-containing protein [Flavobacterium enshiense]
MKTYFTFLIGLLLSFLSYSQPAIQWQKNYGGSADDYGKSICQASDGGYLISGLTGSNDGDITGFHGDYDCWIAKINSTGTIQWKRTLGGSGLDNINSIQQTLDGGYILAGSTNSSDGDITSNQGGYDCWVIKLNSSGTIVWKKTFGGTGWESVLSIQQTSDGGYIFAGYSGSANGDVASVYAGTNFWVVKLDAAGTILWQKTFGGNGQDYAWSIQQTTDGGYIVAGETNSTDGDITSNVVNYDGWIVKLNANGIMQWQRTLGGDNADSIYCIRQTSDGGFILVGNSYGNIYIHKLNANGIPQWYEIAGGTGADIPYDIQQTVDGGYIVAGVTSSTDGDVTENHGGYDYWIVKFDASGGILWQKTLGGSGDDRAFAIQKISDGGYIIAGMSNSTNGDITEYHGDYDYWIVKLTSEQLATNDFQQENSFIIYHNPISNLATISLSLSQPENVSIHLFDLNGRFIKSLFDGDLDFGKKSIDMNTSHLTSGIYLIQIKIGRHYKTQKLIVR